MGFAFAACGLLASLSAFAAASVGGGGPSVPPGAAGLPPYMVTAGDLGNAAYLACVKASLKQPADRNVTANNEAALACQSSARN